MEEHSSSSPLHLCTSHTFYAVFNRTYAFFHLLALLAFIKYRLSASPVYSLLFASELLLSLIWLSTQAFLWRPVSRTVFPERLPENNKLPAIDVFICTADPKKEPPFEVMNTVLSAMALDYPPEKLSVYLSDDAGSSSTLAGIRMAYDFARYWVPFCTRFKITNRCPKVYFSSLGEDDDDDLVHAPNFLEYIEEKHKIKSKYEKFKERMESVEINGDHQIANHEQYCPTIEVLQGKSDNEPSLNEEHIPLLVYVSREKNSYYPTHFKAGALNVLLRVSGILTNSPYILVLDCDMYCNDSTSARQAMCFHLDPQASPSLAFVQFPHKFSNISTNDIYDSQLRLFFREMWPGLDGIQGPILSGSCFYLKRKALYGDILQQNDLEQLKRTFGESNDYLMSVRSSNSRGISSKILQEAHVLATCAYEEHTLWGEQVGFLYKSVVEDYFTGFMLHCKGWTSIYYDPPIRPSFLGSATTNLNDTLLQCIRWNCGLMEVTLSKFSPFIYGLYNYSTMAFLQTMCYAYWALQPLYSFPLWGFATLPQLYLFNSISIYPKVSSYWFLILAFIFLASCLKRLQEVLSSGGDVQTWLNEQRIWMMKSITGYTYGTLKAIMELAGLRKASFLPTNKVAADDDEKITLYRKGKFDFQTSPMLLAPIVSLVTLNIVSLVGGVARICIAADGSWNELFGQIFICFYIVVVNFPVIEGMLLRTDQGRIPLSMCLFSLLLTMIFLYVGSTYIMYC